MHLNGMHGLGDNIYQRAVVRELSDVTLVTPWPQLYADLPVKCIRPITRLRTQAKNAAREDIGFSGVQRGEQARNFGYDGTGTMLESMMRSVGLARDVVTFDGPAVVARPGKYVVVRPVTARAEWRADSRSPKPRYLNMVCEALKNDYTIISVADLQNGAEWPVGTLPFAHEQYHHGEMNLEALLGLVAGAAGVVGGVGWIAPAAVAYKTPMLLVYGGWGKLNGPQRIFDRRMDSSRIVHAMPDKFCMCNDRAHLCDKTITGMENYIDQFVQRIEQQAVAMAS